MARRILKYPLGEHNWKIQLPIDAVIRHVAYRDGTPTIWAQVDDTLPTTEKIFSVYSTGEAIPEGMGFIGTYFVGNNVWHLYVSQLKIS